MSRLKIVAINSSPHDDFGNTAQMLDMLRQRFRSENAEFEEILLVRQHIEYCTGCAMCIRNGSCWIQDDHKMLVDKLLEADGIVLASPVYFFHVTAQMKTFIDRSLGYGHRPRSYWKPGLAVSVSAGSGETAVAEYLGYIMRSFGAFSVGSVTAIALAAGEFVGKDLVEARASRLAMELISAIREKRRDPATDRDLNFYQFIGGLAQSNPVLLKADHEHWKAHGLFNGFETYVGQTRAPGNTDLTRMKQWLKGKIAEYQERSSKRNMEK